MRNIKNKFTLHYITGGDVVCHVPNIEKNGGASACVLAGIFTHRWEQKNTCTRSKIFITNVHHNKIFGANKFVGFGGWYFNTLKTTCIASPEGVQA